MARDAEKRNQEIYTTLKELLAEFKREKSAYALPTETESLFTSHIWGHREIVLTILMGRLVEPRYKASEDFYACNPRSIFEKPIRTFLREQGIPSKKSGPLNVAKNSKKINRDWAANKRGDALAMNVVQIVRVIESLSPTDLRRFAAAYVGRYSMEAAKVQSMSYQPPLSKDPILLSNLCQDMIENAPDGGGTPQIVFGLLLEAESSDRGSKVTITGHRDSVSTTNTTSKKAGDIVETLPQGHAIFEITVKSFSMDRLRESYEAIKADPLMSEIRDVFVVCRKQDVPSEAQVLKSGIILAKLNFEDITYYFFDIIELIREKLVTMTPTSREIFHAELSKHVNDINTSEKVKKHFTQWHIENQT